jgi:hypothetical protein
LPKWDAAALINRQLIQWFRGRLGGRVHGSREVVRDITLRRGRKAQSGIAILSVSTFGRNYKASHLPRGVWEFITSFAFPGHSGKSSRSDRLAIQQVTHAAAERRKSKAHGASRGSDRLNNAAREGRKKRGSH